MGVVAGLSLSAAFCFGLGLVLSNLGLRGMSPLKGAAVGIPVAALFSASLAPFLVDFSQFSPRAVAIFVAVGCMFPLLVTLLTFEANRRIGPSLTGALGNLTPLLAVAIAFVMLGDAPSGAQLAAIGIIVAGVALLLWRPQNLSAGVTLLALALPVGAAAVRGLVQPLVKLGLESWPDPVVAATIGYIVSAVLVIGLSASRQNGTATMLRAPATLWFVAVGICNGCAVLLMYAALARGSVAVVAPLVACYPLATVLLSRAMLGIPIGRNIAVGVALTVLGVVLLLRG
jgi:drug/metabolite transporter (DMT)-like permease